MVLQPTESRVYLLFSSFLSDSKYYWESGSSENYLFLSLSTIISIWLLDISLNSNIKQNQVHQDDHDRISPPVKTWCLLCNRHHLLTFRTIFVHKHQKCLKMAAVAARHILINRLVLECSFTAQDISSLIVIIKKQQQQQNKVRLSFGKGWDQRKQWATILCLFHWIGCHLFTAKRTFIDVFFYLRSVFQYNSCQWTFIMMNNMKNHEMKKTFTSTVNEMIL